MIVSPEPSESYERDLGLYIRNPTEDGLANAYRGGRSALEAGFSLVAFAEMHSRFLSKLFHANSDAVAEDLAASFFAEAMAPYEMALRGYRDGNLVLRRANEQLERTNLIRTRFFAYMSHELRTPLNSVLGFAELLSAQTADRLTDKQARYCANIESAGRQMLHLVNEMFDLTSIEAGTLDVTEGLVDLEQVVHAVLAEEGIRAIDSKVAITFNPIGDMRITGDRGRLVQVVRHLVANALKVTPAGGQIDIDANCGEDDLTIRVTDQGPSLAEEDLRLLLDDYAPAEVVGGSTSPQRARLGLALTKGLVELMGGTIAVQKSTGPGTTYSVTFRRVRFASERAPHYAEG